MGVAASSKNSAKNVKKGEDMKKLLMTLLASLLLNGSAWAEWVKISEHGNGVFYIDPTTLRKDDNLRRIWRITDLKKPFEGAQSFRSRVEYDCKNERSKMLYFSSHSAPMAGGETLGSNNREDEWEAVPPNTVSEDVLKFVCSQ